MRAHLADWYDEYRDITRREWQDRQDADHLLDATRYALMMKRFAKPGPIGAGPSFATSRSRAPTFAEGLDFDLWH